MSNKDDIKDGPDALKMETGEGIAEQMAARKESEQDVKATIFDGVRDSSGGPVDPTKLTPTDEFNFRCHKGVSCWNECCHGADVTLTPYDILTLAKHFDVRPVKFVEDYTVPAIHPGSNLPVPKLVMTGKAGDGPCVFMDDDTGCTVYDSRPATCRYYPLGLGAVKMKGQEQREDMYFLVKEDHCKGHAEDNRQSVDAFRKDQGVEPYDLLNERWVGILMKMASWRSIGGPMGKDVSPQTKKMFYMISTDPDRFRQFVFETKFLDTYEIDADMVEAMRKKDEVLLQLGFDWLMNVMFNDDSALGLKQDVLQRAMADARGGMGAI